jgi:6,7-dimethyl-8-ribityllumazine synthase
MSKARVPRPVKTGSPTVLSASLDAAGLKTAIVASRFNHFIVEKLVGGALDGLVRHGADPSDQIVAWTPGALEIPVVAARFAKAAKVDAIICVGAVIRGGTAHFDYVAGEVSKGIGHITLESGIPVTMGVLTCDTLEQAIDRAGAKHGNKGYEAALAALEAANLLRLIDGAR